MQRYNPADIEPKWQTKWSEDSRYAAVDNDPKPKMYVSGMFPYPSGSGLHSGHAFSYTIVDTIARFYRAHGYNVLNPMGWDTFGLPAENYAIKTGTVPAVVTKQNIANFKRQFKRMGVSIDWDREINTSDPEYYRWTQWVFTQLFNRGLAYQKESMQWWCPHDKTVLANEQVEGGKCWRCGNEVVKKSMKQWFFKITDYADSLLDEIPALDWPDKIKAAQTNWIGRSEGAEIDFEIDGSDDLLRVFTTRPDTIFGATFMVIAPEHPLVQNLKTEQTTGTVDTYVMTALKKSEVERMSEGKEKTGVFTGSYVINPANGQKIPIWIADYVLGGYGTGAIMAVPAHDERDLEFAQKFNLPVKQVIAPFNVHDGIFTPRDDVPTVRKATVDAIITDGKGNYLLQIEDENNVHFVGGGIDPEDDNAEAALTREIKEESGYVDIATIREVAPYDSGLAYRTTKSRNQLTWGNTHEVILGSLEQVRSEIDEGLHTQKWVTKNEVADLITWKFHRAAWDVYVSNDSPGVQIGEGILVNSGQFDGTPSSEAREQIVSWLESQGLGVAKTTYKMRDWLISRQRYWGAPIPIIHCEEHGAVPVPDDQLPVVLPEVEDYAPKGEGRSVLASVEEWVNTTCPTCGKPAKRETDTMDGYACSSWYLLRYADPKNAEQAWNPELANYWSPVDYYVGGDHAVAHLLYVRFWAHVFNDLGLLDHKEPVKKLVYHGYVNAEDGRKMSKSLGNVIDPLDIIDQGYGADTLRAYVLFMGPIELDSAWSSQGVGGVYRFLNRVWTLTQEYLEADKKNTPIEPSLESLRHKTIKKVTKDYRDLGFNTVIAALMEYVNELYKAKQAGFTDDWQSHLETLVRLLSPLAPHMSAELWEQLGHADSLDTTLWPQWDDALTVSETITVVIQVNGKVRGKVVLPADVDERTAVEAAMSEPNVARFIDGKPPKKTVYVAGRLVSIVV
ncbi:leucine--tRNA ligase [Candidatus Saccharibacteria bacterium]|nr:leucine--tRNA ligase [Candidatus Saccharibacteria bacterium]